MDELTTNHPLTQAVLDRINQLGDAEATTYFDVSLATITNWKTGKGTPSVKAVCKVYDDSLAFNSPEIQGGSGKEEFALLLPSYENVDPMTEFSTMRAIKNYGAEKVKIIPKARTLIDEARCDLAEKFLLTGLEWCIFRDGDMLLPCDSAGIAKKMGIRGPDSKLARNAFTRLMSHPKECRIVGGLYVDRRGRNLAQCSRGFTKPADNARYLDVFTGKTKDDGLEEQDWIGFGLVRIHRSVFLEMKEAALKGGPLAEIAPPKGRETEPFGFFGRTSKQRGEDVAFCRRAGFLGIKVHLDLGLPMGHCGRRVY